ncbi:MAG: hypothetical protein FJW69_09195 [Actinobacteria bacterium]|nr:hypothetical protein [Actinomycetota bacterium]
MSKEAVEEMAINYSGERLFMGPRGGAAEFLRLLPADPVTGELLKIAGNPGKGKTAALLIERTAAGDGRAALAIVGGNMKPPKMAERCRREFRENGLWAGIPRNELETALGQAPGLVLPPGGEAVGAAGPKPGRKAGNMRRGRTRRVDPAGPSIPHPQPLSQGGRGEKDKGQREAAVAGGSPPVRIGLGRCRLSFCGVEVEGRLEMVVETGEAGGRT